MPKKNIAYRVNVVQHYSYGGSSSAKWIDVGVAFAHNDGKGLDIVLAAGLSVSDRLVLREPLPAKKVAPIVQAPQDWLQPRLLF